MTKEDADAPVAPAILCTLCQNLLQAPLACSECDVLICKSCIDNHSKKDNTCPNCLLTFKAAESAKLKRVIEVMLPAKIIKCRNCSQPSAYNGARKHAYECRLQKRTCGLSCGVPILFVGRDGILKHYINDCPEMDLICPRCKFSTKRKMVDSHQCVPKSVGESPTLELDLE